MTDRDIERELRTKLSLPKYRAGRALGWGRRATDTAVNTGKMPIIDGPKPRVATSWLRKQLGLSKTALLP